MKKLITLDDCKELSWGRKAVPTVDSTEFQKAFRIPQTQEDAAPWFLISEYGAVEWASDERILEFECVLEDLENLTELVFLHLLKENKYELNFLNNTVKNLKEKIRFLETSIEQEDPWENLFENIEKAYETGVERIGKRGEKFIRKNFNGEFSTHVMTEKWDAPVSNCRFAPLKREPWEESEFVEAEAPLPHGVRRAYVRKVVNDEIEWCWVGQSAIKWKSSELIDPVPVEFIPKAL